MSITCIFTTCEALKSTFCIGGWGQSRSLFHVGGSEEYSNPPILHRRAEFTRAVMCARSDERGKWGERERELRAQLPILNHYEEAEYGGRETRERECMLDDVCDLMLCFVSQVADGAGF